MSEPGFLKRFIIAITVLLAVNMLHADEPDTHTQPKFTIIPTTQVKWVIPSNGAATITYVVTNQTKITRTLTMKPIPGITQKTTGFGVCGSTFTLAHGQSCSLVLPLDGSKLSGHIVGGPVICKTNGHGDNGPDPFLCSQPSKANSLDITSTGFENALITTSEPPPNILSLQANLNNLPNCNFPQSVTVTNQSKTVTVSGITASPWLGSGVTVSYSGGCASLPPGSSACTITFTAGTIIPTSSTHIYLISGSNGAQTSVNAIVIQGGADLNVSPLTTVLTFPTGNTSQNITIQNINSCVSANNVAIHPSNALGSVHFSSTCPTELLPSATCTITATQGGQVVPESPAPIYGSNTTKAPTTVEVQSDQVTLYIVCNPVPSPVVPGCNIMNLTPHGSNGTLTVYNKSALLTALGVTVSGLPGAVTQVGSPCGSIAPLHSCTFTFSPGNTMVTPAATFVIKGTNTAPNTTNPPQVSVTDAQLSFSSSSSVTNKDLVLAQQGALTPLKGVNPAQISKARQLTITNRGTVPAVNVTYTISVLHPLPISTTISPSACGNIQPNQSCVLVITPGPNATAAAPNEPTPTDITISGENTNTLTASVTVLTYGNLYQGSGQAAGFVFDMDDSPAPESSIQGKIATVQPVNRAAAWDSSTFCNNSQCQNIATTLLNGLSNTTTIDLNLGVQPQPYAAQQCNTSTLDGTWYSPAACEMGAFANTGICNTADGFPIIPNIANITAAYPSYSFAADGASNWSSSQCVDPSNSDCNSPPPFINFAYYTITANSTTKLFTANKNTNVYNVFCARKF